jgi:DMSO/TMAO reductase YedYZ molybdopterin-dependent catalytic subunit
MRDPLEQHDSAASSPNRRAALQRIAAAGTAWLAGPILARAADDPGGPGLIVRNREPLDAESPVEAFATWLTPNDSFFVRSHFGAPATNLVPSWTLKVLGLVERPLTLTLDDLRDFEPAEAPAVLQCSGNGRGFFEPRVAGVGWSRGAVGNASWGGVRLADVLERAGVRPGARHVHMLGADLPPTPKTPPFYRSLPLERALDRGTLVATTMNDEPLPRLHGGPLRVVVPTWTGNHWLKWLRALVVSDVEHPGFYQQVGYRLPKVPAPPGAPVPPEGLAPVTTMNVKSLFARPSRDATLERGRVELRGVAWTGAGLVARVEVSIDGGPWSPATLEGPEREGSWRLWSLDWDAPPGAHTARVRATDSAGQVQPAVPPWNKSGYLWNGIDEVRFNVR